MGETILEYDAYIDKPNYLIASPWKFMMFINSHYSLTDKIDEMEALSYLKTLEEEGAIEKVYAEYFVYRVDFGWYNTAKSNVEKDTFHDIELFIREIVALALPVLDETSVQFVNHYLDHAEYELAFEGLFMDLMKLERLPGINLAKSKEIALLLKLNEQSVLDADFWEQFDGYIGAINK